ncbi:MAG: hypothetical protein ACK50N_01700, partial [Flavobacteriales bacterium]
LVLSKIERLLYRILANLLCAAPLRGNFEPVAPHPFGSFAVEKVFDFEVYITLFYTQQLL